VTVDSHDADWHGADVDEVSMVAWDMADMGKAPSSIAQVFCAAVPRRDHCLATLTLSSIGISC
jgi:hypothetical protein